MVGYLSDNTPENLSHVEAGKRLFEFHQDRFVSPTKGSDIDLHYLYRHYSQLAHQLFILADERHSLKQRIRMPGMRSGHSRRDGRPP